MTRTKTKSSIHRFQRAMRRSFGAGSGGRALGVLVAVAVAAAGIVLSGDANPAPAAPLFITAPSAPSHPDAPTNIPVKFQHGPLSGTIALGHSGIVTGTPQQVLVDIDLDAHGDATARRVPVAMTLVLDRSGSMSGQKLEQARRSVLQALEGMHDDDYFGFVAYDHGAEVMIPLQRVGFARSSMRGTILSVRTGGGTQIPAGLQAGFQTLASAPAGYSRRVVLVSDGIDGSGIGPAGIRSSVLGFGRSGVTVAALGIGTDYDEAFLTAVADAGNGAYAYLATGGELQAFLQRELDAASSTVAERVALDLALPRGTHFVRAHGAVAQSLGNGVRLEVGNMASGDERHVVVELQAHTATAGHVGDIPVSIAFHDRHQDRMAQVSPGSLALYGVADAAVASATVSGESYAAAKAVLIEVAQTEAMERWEQGDTEGAIALARDNANELRRVRRQYAPASPILEVQAAAAEDDAANFGMQAPSSAGGRAYRLESNTRRRDRTR